MPALWGFLRVCLDRTQILLRFLPKGQGKRWLTLGGLIFAFLFVEMMTTFSIIFFGSIMGDPQRGQNALARFGFGVSDPGIILLIFSAVVAVSFILKNVLEGAVLFFQNWVLQKTAKVFKDQLVQKLAGISYDDFVRRNTTFYQNVLVNDSQNLFQFGLKNLVSIVPDILLMLLFLGILFFVHVRLAVLVFGLFVGACGLFYVFLLPHVRTWGRNSSKLLVSEQQEVAELLGGFKEIILKRAFDTFSGRLMRLHQQSWWPKLLSDVSVHLPRFFLEITFMTVFVVLVWFVGVWRGEWQSLPPLLGLYLYVGFRFLPILNRFLTHLHGFTHAFSAIERISIFENLSRPETLYASQPKLSFQKQLVFSNVSFSYGPKLSKTLSGVSLQVMPGERVGIAGKTGSGKTTFLGLFMGLLRPKSGTILIDGRYVPASADWHKMIGYVPQDPYMLDASLQRNIAFDAEDAVDEKRLRHILKLCCLDDLAAKLPKGLETTLGTQGVRLSGGERQRVAIARALYANPPILVFDEATSALDQRTEKKILDNLYSLGAQKTVVMVAHRLQTLQGCSKIFEFGQGRLKGVRTYKQILHSAG